LGEAEAIGLPQGDVAMVDYFVNFWTYLPALLVGLKLTMIIAIAGIFLAVVMGIVLCIFSISGVKALQRAASLYITIVRGIPLMILALFLYFGVIRNSLNYVYSAIIILAINASAFMAEIFRAGFQAVDYGQTEASRSLGLSYFQTIRKVVLPQALKIMIPSLMNQFIGSLKDTAILCAIGVPELTMTAKIIIARNYMAFELYSYAAIIYLAVIAFLTYLSKIVERKTSYDKR
jgi:glutamine transport system permease protein